VAWQFHPIAAGSSCGPRSLEGPRGARSAWRERRPGVLPFGLFLGGQPHSGWPGGGGPNRLARPGRFGSDPVLDRGHGPFGGGLEAGSAAFLDGLRPAEGLHGIHGPWRRDFFPPKPGQGLAGGRLAAHGPRAPGSRQRAFGSGRCLGTRPLGVRNSACGSGRGPWRGRAGRRSAGGEGSFSVLGTRRSASSARGDGHRGGGARGWEPGKVVAGVVHFARGGRAQPEQSPRRLVRTGGQRAGRSAPRARFRRSAKSDGRTGDRLATETLCGGCRCGLPPSQPPVTAFRQRARSRWAPRRTRGGARDRSDRQPPGSRRGSKRHCLCFFCSQDLDLACGLSDLRGQGGGREARVREAFGSTVAGLRRESAWLGLVRPWGGPGCHRGP